jgi:tetraacyldisaccharide 4'-kinase
MCSFWLVMACTASCTACSSMPEMRGLRRWLEQGWYARQPVAWLQPLAGIYGLANDLRRRMYRHGVLSVQHAGVPTVVVGNFTVGGTGKTPLVQWLAACLREAGHRPGIVLRGYKGQQRAPRLVSPDDAPRLVGDEAVLHARIAQCPVAVGAARVAAARLLVQSGCDFIIADDGLQHLALGRDLEIIVVDGARGFGNGALLPAGPLREHPVSRWHAGAVLVANGEDVHGVLAAGNVVAMRLEPRSLRSLGGNELLPLDRLRGATVHALAGIGNPQRFFAMLRQLGAIPVEHPRPDHWSCSAADLDFGDAHPVVMTAKDAVKCEALAAGRNSVFWLEVGAALPVADAARLRDRVLATRRS